MGFEQRKNLLNNLAGKERSEFVKRFYAEQAKATEIHVGRIRAMLLAEAPQRPQESGAARW